MVEVRLIQTHWQQLEQVLLQRRDIESKCFLLCKAIEHGSDVALLVCDIVPVPDKSYQHRSAGLVVVRREFVHKLLVQCAESNLCLVEAHTHPWGASVRFSSIDMGSDPKKFAATQSMSPPFRHAALVFGGDMSFDGHLWDYRRQRLVPVDRLKIIGWPLQIRNASWVKSSDLVQAQQEVFDRQIRAFGQEGQRVLRDLTVSIVGLGGLGSQVAQALALLGVGRFILVDPDRLEASNANRIVCVSSRQVAKKLPKVEAIAETLKQICPVPPSFLSIRSKINETQAWQAVLMSDVLIGTVDSASARQFMNLLSVCSLTPYLDAGVGVQAQEGHIQNAGGQVKTVLPGTDYCLACLNCEVRQQVEEQLTPEQREQSQRHGYIQGERVPNPQVVFLNGIVANILAWEVVKLATGCLPANTYLYYDLMAQELYSPSGVKQRPDCLVCSTGGLLGMGEAAIRDFAGTSKTPQNLPMPAST